MADQNSYERVTRMAAKKRAAAEALASEQLKKKRVVLGEIQNVLSLKDADSRKNRKLTISPWKQKRVTRGRAKKTDRLEIENGDGIVVDPKYDDPLLCEAYSADIRGYLLSMEVEAKRRPLSNYMEKIQKDVNAIMRGVLIDWLVEVAEEYKLLPDTLYLTVSYIDRYLSVNSINRKRLQLLGVSSMLVASKYEEITPPNVEDFCYITDSTYCKDEVVTMEADVLKSLKFEMGNPTVNTFLRKFIEIGREGYENYGTRFEFLCCYLSELSLLDYGCVKFLPSMVAASVVFLARFTFQPKIHPWSSALECDLGYKAMELKECVCIMHDLQLRRRGSSLVAVREKYKQDKFKGASMLVSPSEVPGAYFDLSVEGCESIDCIVDNAFQVAN